jgi:CheY-like chemotaxis protein
MVAPSTRRVILVDDEEALVWSLASRLARVRPTERFVTATNGEAALETLRDGEPPVLVIADIRMPGMSGIDLVLAARESHPQLPAILMTAFKTVDLARVSEGPFTGFLEKPFAFEKLLALVERALEPPRTGFSGAISVQTMPDIVQLYALSSATGMLTVKHGEELGELWFENGAVRHAQTPRHRGDEAFYEVMTWSGGEFWMRAGAQTNERSVVTSWQELLMESCRRIDEAKREGGRQSRRGWTQAPPPPSEEDEDGFDLGFAEFEPAAPSGAASERATPNMIEKEGTEDPMNVKDALTKLNAMDGFVGAALVDSESGMLLGQEGGGAVNLEIAAAGNTEVVRAKRKTMGNLGLKDAIEDILITLGKQYHLIRPLRSRPTIFFYVALDRSRANLAMARIALADVERDLQV